MQKGTVIFIFSNCTRSTASLLDASRIDNQHSSHLAGAFVRFGPNRISVNTNEGLHKIYGTKANTQKSSYYHVFNDVFKGDSSLTTIEPGLHARKKRVVSSALSDSSVRAMEELVLRNVRTFCNLIGKGANSADVSNGAAQKPWSAPKNMTDWSDYLSFDVMGDICFSGSFGMLEKEDNRYVLRVLPEGVNGFNMVFLHYKTRLGYKN